MQCGDPFFFPWRINHQPHCQSVAGDHARPVGSGHGGLTRIFPSVPICARQTLLWRLPQIFSMLETWKTRSVAHPDYPPGVALWVV